MTDRYFSQRQSAGRKPLGDGASQANAASGYMARPRTDKHPQTVSQVPAPIPHNESIIPHPDGHGKPKIRPTDKPLSPGHKRVAKLAAEEQQVSCNRDSAYSNASTTGSERKRKTHIGPWQLGKTIGRGGCSKVRAVRHSTNGQYGAAKIIEKSIAESVRAISLANLIASSKNEGKGGDPAIPIGLEREIVIMKLLNHRNIVKLFDVWENRNEIYLIMEYVPGGELFNYISDRRGLDEDEAVFLFRQIIAALLYCHRINIHHRDLKPENILLDRNTFELKLVDFGMAALQPAGKYLSTPCGSPHYAAPEVIKTKQYDGGKADVWSCGVILFVMLAGYPPFTYSGEDRDLKELFRQIVHADYTMPSTFTPEAKDLIKRVLEVDPRKRISIEQIWSHPLVTKYDKLRGYSDEEVGMEAMVGPRPTLDDWTPLTRENVDKEILHSMRVLWHSEKLETLIRRLISSELNHEKYFYSALLKHRAQQLEDYAGLPGGVGYSTSDYHHDRTPTTEDAPAMPAMPARSKSAYSIMNNEHLYSKHSFYEPPTSDADYDPYRSSRTPITADSRPGATVTVHRNNSSSDSRKKRTRPTSSTLRVETLRRGRHPNSARSLIASSNPSRSNMSKRSSIVRRSIASSARSVSKVSMASSNWPSSPPVFTRPRGSTYKRGVSFAHMREKSAAGTWVTESVFIGDDTSHSLPVPASPTTPSPPPPPPHSSPKKIHVTSPRKKKALIPNQGHVKIRKPGPSPSQYINQDVRKVSTELDRLCQDAFFRSSMEDSGVSQSLSDKPSPYETPPSSISKKSSGLGVAQAKGDYQSRPLPRLPGEPGPTTTPRYYAPKSSAETPNTFIAREIIETRDRIQKRSQAEGNAENFDEVLLHLDNLIKPHANRASKRSASTPQQVKQAIDTALQLPAISEEGRYADGEDKQNHGHRSVTDPMSRRPAQLQRGMAHDDRMIRVVPPSSPPTIAPLNIRKASGASSRSSERGGAASAQPRPSQPAITYSSHDADLPSPPLEHAATHLHDALDKPKTIKKKRSWLFGWKEKEAKKEEERSPTSTSEPWRSLDDRQIEPSAGSTTNRAGPSKLTKRAPSDPSVGESEFPIRKAKVPRKGFLRMFSRFAKNDDSKIMEFDGHDISHTSINSGNDYSNADDNIIRDNADYQTSWFNRFFHIKPASGVICLQVRRGRARQEFVRLLRGWKPYGIRDIHFDRHANSISARVSKNNFLHIRPVSFIIELFVILEHGRRAQLCLARLTQTKGAASSFKKVLETVESTFGDEGLLVADEEQRKAMCEVLAV